MSVIDTKDWHVQIDKMPSTEGPKIHVRGTVTFPHSGFEVTLEGLATIDPPQSGPAPLKLELVVKESSEASLTVITEKQVSFSTRAIGEISNVIVYHGQKELVRIDNIAVTN